MKLIALTKFKIAKVDDEDYEWLTKWNWCAQSNPSGQFHAVRSVTILGKQQKIYMHRQIMKAPHDMFVDHINRDTLDNQRSNLRIVTPQQNARNRKTPASSSKYKGVDWDTRLQRWRVQIQVGPKKLFLGYYKSEDIAAQVYDIAAKKHFGEHAYLNFPIIREE